MAFSSGNEKIDNYLNELSEEYKELLFKSLLNQSSSFDNLNVSDLLRIDNEIKKPLLMDHQKNQRKKQMLLGTGMLYMLIGFIVYVFSNTYLGNLDVITLITLTIWFFGFLMTIYAFLPLNMFARKMYANNRRENQDVSLLSYEIVTKWRKLESIANDLNIDKHKILSYSIMQFFLNNRYITDEEAKELKNFLKLRNEIVHASATTYTLDELTNAISTVNSIINKLEKIV